MDRELWKCLTRALGRAERAVRRRLRPEKKVQYASTLIVRMYLWQVSHDRPMHWACQRSHYSDVFRPRKLPSYSQYTRRLRHQRIQQLLQALHDQLSGLDQTPLLSYLDGKLLPVAMHSQDQDATKVRVNSGYVRGYRLHAWAGDDERIRIWAITGAHAGEQTLARHLCRHMPALASTSVVLADVRFDSARLYADIAQLGGALLTPMQSMSKDRKLRQRMGPGRREAIEIWEQHKNLGRLVLRQRLGVERIFSQLCSTSGGLSHLPPWVRRFGRVQPWVGVKVILHNARICLRQRRATTRLNAG